MRPQSPRWSEDAGVAIACRVGWSAVAFGAIARMYKLVTLVSGDASGGGREKNFDERSSLAVGEVLVGMASEVFRFCHVNGSPISLSLSVNNPYILFSSTLRTIMKAESMICRSGQKKLYM